MAEFNVWLLILGIVAGAAVTWLIVGSISRRDDDIAAAEQPIEAAWIARLIEEHGGRAPVALVEQILELHRRYLRGGPSIPLPETPPDRIAEPAGPPEASTTSGRAAATSSGPAAIRGASGGTAPDLSPPRRHGKDAHRPDERAETPAG